MASTCQRRRRELQRGYMQRRKDMEKTTESSFSSNLVVKLVQMGACALPVCIICVLAVLLFGFVTHCRSPNGHSLSSTKRLRALSSEICMWLPLATTATSNGWLRLQWAPWRVIIVSGLFLVCGLVAYFPRFNLLRLARALWNVGEASTFFALYERIIHFKWFVVYCMGVWR